jgi:hypothetical protein
MKTNLFPVTTQMACRRGIRNRTITLLAALSLAAVAPPVLLAQPVLDPPVKAVLFASPENTAEEMIFVGADSVEGPWSPLPEPIFKRHGEFATVVPTTEPMQIVKLVPGTQFIDDFDPAKPPFSGKDPWVPGFYNAEDASRFEITNASGTLRIHTLTPPVFGQVPIRLPGAEVAYKDFCASVDILELQTTNLAVGKGEAAWIGIGARVDGNPNDPFPGTRAGFIGGVVPNSGALNRAQLNIYNGSDGDRDNVFFTFKPGTPYRLIFSGVGTRLTVQLIDLETQQPAVAPLVRTYPTSPYTQGPVALWIQSGFSAMLDTTLDNFFVTGRKP